MATLKKNPNFEGVKGPLVTIVMDGVGIAPDNGANAVCAANTPTLDRLLSTYPTVAIKAHGTAVGLPSDDDMGNSEVGHNALGCGQQGGYLHMYRGATEEVTLHKKMRLAIGVNDEYVEKRCDVAYAQGEHNNKSCNKLEQIRKPSAEEGNQNRTSQEDDIQISADKRVGSDISIPKTKYRCI